jgi:hypothetical protein
LRYTFKIDQRTMSKMTDDEARYTAKGDTAGAPHSPLQNDPPTYMEATAQEKQSHGFIIALEVALYIPFLAAATLLALATYSGNSLRPDFSVVKIRLPGNVFEPLYAVSQSLNSNSTSNSTIVRRDSSGYLSLGVWGWCLRDSDATR